MKKLFFLIAALVVVGWGGWKTWNSSAVQSWRAEQEKNKLPAAETLAESIAAPAINAAQQREQLYQNANRALPVLELPVEKNLAVPFTSQAPHATWDQDHNEFCEEASILMVGRYFQRRGIDSPDDAEAALQQIKQWEIDNLGWYYDTTAEETARVIEGVYHLEVKIVRSPTIDHIKTALAQGRLVIAPFAGREIGNPNYTPPGPIYHMMVFRGYTSDGKFIMNDPGTRRGEEYVYDQQHLMDVMHDWVPNAPRTTPANGSPSGSAVMLVVSPTS